MAVINMSAPARGTAQHGQPAVLFIDDVGWDCFFQLAAGLKRAGIRTIRVTRSRRTRTASLLLFDRAIHHSDSAGHLDLPGILEGEDIIDVQMTENMVTAAGKEFTLLPRTQRTEAWTRRAAVMDKLLVAERLGELGFFTPPVLTGPNADADQIIQRLGLPVMRKLRTASGGEGMSIVRTREELETLLTKDQRSDSYFFERCIEGRQLQVAGVFGDGDDAVVTYETLQRRSALAPASLIRTIDDPGLVETGRAAVKALGIAGMININVIRDAEGRDWIHDVNPRVFGSFMAFRTVGVDLLQAYVEWLRTTPGLPADRQGDENSLVVFPAAFRTDSGGSPSWKINGILRAAGSYRHWAGPRYVAYEIGRQLVYEMKRRLNRQGWPPTR